MNQNSPNDHREARCLLAGLLGLLLFLNVSQIDQQGHRKIRRRQIPWINPIIPMN
jgi:hypothetical protein